MVLDLTREFSTEAPPYTTISKPDKSTFSMGMLFSWKDTLYQFQGFAHVFEYTQPLYGASREWWNNYGSKRRTGQTFRLWSLDSGKEWVAGQLFTETEPQRAGIGASAVMERRGMGYYLGGAIVNADGKYEQSLYELMTVWDVRNSKWEAVRGPDQPKVGRVNGVLVAMEEFGSSGMLLAMGGVRASSSNVSVDQEGVCLSAGVGCNFSRRFLTETSSISEWSNSTTSRQRRGCRRKPAASTRCRTRDWTFAPSSLPRPIARVPRSTSGVA